MGVDKGWCIRMCLAVLYNIKHVQGTPKETAPLCGAATLSPTPC